jgi:hypothetical protein
MALMTSFANIARWFVATERQNRPFARIATTAVWVAATTIPPSPVASDGRVFGNGIWDLGFRRSADGPSSICYPGTVPDLAPRRKSP